MALGAMFLGGVFVSAERFNLLESMARQGLTRANALATFRQRFGTGFRFSIWSDVRARQSNKENQRSRYKNLRRGMRPDPTRIPNINVREQPSATYRVSGVVNWTNTTTGESQQTFVRFGTDTLLTKEEFEDRGRAALTHSLTGDYDVVIDEFVYDNVIRWTWTPGE